MTVLFLSLFHNFRYVQFIQSSRFHVALRRVGILNLWAVLGDSFIWRVYLAVKTFREEKAGDQNKSKLMQLLQCLMILTSEKE